MLDHGFSFVRTSAAVRCVWVRPVLPELGQGLQWLSIRAFIPQVCPQPCPGIVGLETGRTVPPTPGRSPCREHAQPPAPSHAPVERSVNAWGLACALNRHSGNPSGTGIHFSQGSREASGSNWHLSVAGRLDTPRGVRKSSQGCLWVTWIEECVCD